MLSHMNQVMNLFLCDQANQLQVDLAGENGCSTNILTWIMDQFPTVLGGTAASDTAINMHITVFMT